MSNCKYGLRVLGLLAVLLLVVCSGYAQYRASIQGVVTDPDGAVVAGATVTLKDLATGQTQVATTNGDGIYNFNALPPDRFSVTVEKQGFKRKVLDNVGVIAEQANAVNIQLDLGVITESVTVSGNSTPLLDTETASVSGTVSDNDIQHIPSFGRDVFQLVQLAPGMFGDGAQAVNGGAQLPGTQGPGGTGGNQGIFQTENGPQALAVGQQYENNSYSIDGINTTSAVWGGTTIITPSEDSIDSVKVLSNGYDAEYGRFAGAQVQVISKSGTNDFHGSAFFTAHRPGLNAYQRFNGQGNAVLRDTDFYDQFGASGGGPILKNKLFFFFAWETVRSPVAAAGTANGWYDTAAFDALAPSGSIASKYLSFPGNGPKIIANNNSTCADAGLVDAAHATATQPANCAEVNGGLNIGTPLTTALGTQDPTWQNATNPGVGSGLGTTADIANYETSSTSTTSKNQYNGRLDWNVTGRDRLALALYYVPQSSSFLNGPAREYNFFHHSQINEAFSVIWDHTFSPTLVNEFRTNAAGWRWNEVNSNPQSPVGLPSDTIDTVGSINLSSFGPNVGSILDQWTYGYKDVATKVLGRHTIKFGGDVTRLFYLQDCAGCGVPGYNFFNIWDFLNDAPQKESTNFNPATGAPTTLRQDDRENIWGLFVQDDFKLRTNLTLNLGLRYNYFGPISSKEGNMFVATPGAGAAYMTGLTVHKGDSWNAEKNNFGPEIGLAWTPGMFKGKLVVRGGYGLNYNQEEIAISANISGNPGLVVNPNLSQTTPSAASCASPLPNCGIIYAVSSGIHDLTGYPANPNAVTTFGANGLPLTGTANVSIFPNTLPTMRIHHWSAEVQYDMGFDTVASVGYQGSHSSNTYFHENPNALPAALGDTLNPQIGGGDYWGVLGHGNYNAMLAELNHRFSHEFQTDAQFAWSKCMDTSSGPYFEQPYVANVNEDYGRCDYNVQDAFKVIALWQPHFFHGSNAWVEKVAGGWSVSGIFNIHSGFPWTPEFSFPGGGSLYCGTCGYSTIFPSQMFAGAGNSTSDDAFKTGSNYPKGGEAYFAVPNFFPFIFTGSGFGSTLPPAPGVARNSLNGPGYKDVDLTLMKGFGLPKLPALGENARIEFRMDAYNLFNNLNFNPGSISNNIANANFGQMTQALAGRIVTLGARFSF